MAPKRALQNIFVTQKVGAKPSSPAAPPPLVYFAYCMTPQGTYISTQSSAPLRCNVCHFIRSFLRKRQHSESVYLQLVKQLNYFRYQMQVH